MAKLVFLGRLADLAGNAEFSVADGAVADILAALPLALSTALLDTRVRLALNGAVLRDAVGLVLGADDELAFLPPVSGG